MQHIIPSSPATPPAAQTAIRNATRTVLVAVAVLAASTALAPAWAQGANPAQLITPGNGSGPKPATGNREPPPPTALPGARAEPTAVAPAAKNVMDLPPTDALFDAINRGDLTAAKDAVNRGADLNGTNVLGLSPIDLAVDLGRNQISFYLLSLRGGTVGASASPGGALLQGQASGQSQGQPMTRAEKLAAARQAKADARAERLAERRSITPASAAPPGPATAHLFASDGGAPNPQAGFLGFNAR